MTVIFKIQTVEINCFQKINELSQVLLVNTNKISSKTKVFAINSLLSEKQEQQNFAPLYGESKLYCQESICILCEIYPKCMCKPANLQSFCTHSPALGCLQLLNHCTSNRHRTALSLCSPYSHWKIVTALPHKSTEYKARLYYISSQKLLIFILMMDRSSIFCFFCSLG